MKFAPLFKSLSENFPEGSFRGTVLGRLRLVLTVLNERSKPLIIKDLLRFRGERGIRTPGGVTLNGFQDRRDRPLRHLSMFLCVSLKNVAKVGTTLRSCKFFWQKHSETVQFL